MRRNTTMMFVGLGAIGLAAYFLSSQSQAAIADTIPGEDTPDPGPDFGLLDKLESTLSANWKVNEYPKYASAISDTEVRYNIPTDLLARVFYQESHYRADIISGDKRSPAGALGIAQLMPDTARGLGMTVTDTQDDRTNPFMSIEKGAQLLVQYYNQFSQDWRSALGAYNWGPGNMNKYLRGVTNTRTGEPYQLPQETADYIAQVSADIPAIA